MTKTRQLAKDKKEDENDDDDDEKPQCNSGADEQELATPILSLCHGIFTD